MSDGIDLYSPCCFNSLANQKEYDKLKVKLKQHSLKHQEDDIWYESELPVYTCVKCGKQWAIEGVNK